MSTSWENWGVHHTFLRWPWWTQGSPAWWSIMSLKWPKRPINDPNDSSNEQNQPTSMMRQSLDIIQWAYVNNKLRLFFFFFKTSNENQNRRRPRQFLDEWISGSVFLMTWLCKHKYMYLFRANKGPPIIPAFSLFVPIYANSFFVPICANSSVEISSDGRGLGLKHARPEDGINSVFHLPKDSLFKRHHQ